MKGFVTVDVNKAVNTGLQFRPLSVTVQDALAWYRTMDDGLPLKAGLTREREKELLKKWKLFNQG